MNVRQLIASFNDRANKSEKGEYYLTEKQYKFVLSLAEKERVSIEMLEIELGVKFRVWCIGKNARFYGTKYFSNVIQRQQEEANRAHERVQND